jgi:hypothetical protein
MPPPGVHPLGRLLGGEWVSGSDLGTIIEYLADTLTGLIAQATQLDFADPTNPQVPVLGPYLTRGILEVGFAIMLGRLDPFRVLVLRHIQQSSDYEIELRHNCALQWRGDFLADEKVENLWKPSRKPKDMTRALLGDYHDHVFWRPSLESLLDAVPDGRGGQGPSNLRLISPDAFAAHMRSRAERAYTACSKGVHHEFVIPLSAYYDSQQMQALLVEVLEISAALGLVLNSGTHVPFRLTTEQALTCFESIQQRMQEIHA